MLLMYVFHIQEPSYPLTKQRKKILVPIQQLKGTHLIKGIIGKQKIVETLAGFGHYPALLLRPILGIFN